MERARSEGPLRRAPMLMSGSIDLQNSPDNAKKAAEAAGAAAALAGSQKGGRVSVRARLVPPPIGLARDVGNRKSEVGNRDRKSGSETGSGNFVSQFKRPDIGIGSRKSGSEIGIGNRDRKSGSEAESLNCVSQLKSRTSESKVGSRETLTSWRPHASAKKTPAPAVEKRPNA